MGQHGIRRWFGTDRSGQHGQEIHAVIIHCRDVALHILRHAPDLQIRLLGINRARTGGQYQSGATVSQQAGGMGRHSPTERPAIDHHVGETQMGDHRHHVAGDSRDTQVRKIVI